MLSREEKEKAFNHHIETVEKSKTEYTEALEFLIDSSKKLDKEILLPISSVAFAKATIYHTNEILVALGDDYFIERSSHEAQEIINRRLKKSLKENKRKALEEMGGKIDLGDGTFEIIEEYQQPETTSKTRKPDTIEEEKKTSEKKQPQETKATKKNVSFSNDTKPEKEVVEQEPPKKVSKFKQERMQQK